VSRTKQFRIAIRNRPGAVAEIARTLGNAKVNILALLGTAQGTAATVQVVVDDSGRAKKALDETKISYEEMPAEQFELPNKAGALAEYLEKLAERSVSLNSIYATAHKDGKSVTVVYSVEAEGAPAAAAVTKAATGR
jgi:hypothetical protein